MFLPLLPQTENAFTSMHFSLLRTDGSYRERDMVNTEDVRVQECACLLNLLHVQDIELACGLVQNALLVQANVSLYS